MSARLRAFLRGFEEPELAPRSSDPWQQPTWFYPDLPSRPFPDARRFGWIPRLERAARDVKRELFASLAAFEPDRHVAHAQLVDAGAWHRLTLFDRGRPDTSNVARFPETVRVVESIPGAASAGLVYFSLLAPRTHVRPHFGPINTRLRCHLGLSAPRGAELFVAGKRRVWHPGRCLVFDDSFAHEAINPTDAPRAVLIVDVWHPDLDEAERAALTAFFDARAGHALHDRAYGVAALGALGSFSNVEPRARAKRRRAG